MTESPIPNSEYLLDNASDTCLDLLSGLPFEEDSFYYVRLQIIAGKPDDLTGFTVDVTFHQTINCNEKQVPSVLQN